jgi:hypothetical protein
VQAAPPVQAAPLQYAEVPLEEVPDFLHETLRAEIERTIMADTHVMAPMEEEEEVEVVSAAKTVLFEPERGEFVFEGAQENQGVIEEAPAPFANEGIAAENMPTDDLQPGGVGSGAVAHASALETMTTKELRRLAIQRGISGVNDMKKKDIIAAIRAQPSIDIFTMSNVSE